ncbi:hypothetical protein BDV98DRAFT_592292 [Pterulicium gracile]|uniref:F-box domain-containing protein n=1 Tax=Pterulicium gracile TaxID=1884261 RepID=A0A5C3QQ26_9AGAR|nr:hypothetical protein BDV98DRAFT_592292 [Pterula gracilis]
MDGDVRGVNPARRTDAEEIGPLGVLIMDSFLSSWRGLRTLRLVSCSATTASIVNILQLTSQRLDTLEINHIALLHPTLDDPSSASFSSILNLPTLRSAEFSPQLLMRIRAPNLVEFKLGYHYADTSGLQFAHDFIRASDVATSWKKLELMVPPMCQELLSLLSDLPALDVLLVGFNRGECNLSLLLRALYWQRNTHATPAQHDAPDQEDATVDRFCPKLADIEFQFYGAPSDDIDTDTISQLLELFVRSRARVSADEIRVGSPSFLESVRIAPGVMERPAWLESMEEEGLINRCD